MCFGKPDIPDVPAPAPEDDPVVQAAKTEQELLERRRREAARMTRESLIIQPAANRGGAGNGLSIPTP